MNKLAKVRQDAWSHEDDLLLAETVLRHIREGSTQLKAFEEVGDQLNRTSAACGFRWNAEVRNKYINAIDLAKRQRKEKKRAAAKKTQIAGKMGPSDALEGAHNHSHRNVIKEDAASELTLDRVIQFLTKLKSDYQHANQSKSTLNKLEEENDTLQHKVNDLKKQLEKTEHELQTIKEDYQVFMQIMDRARKMTVFPDQEPTKAPAFRMDKNGNLQQIAQGSNQ